MKNLKKNKEKIFYGNEHTDQFFELYKIEKETDVLAVLIHGGFYKEKYDLNSSGIDALIPSLLNEGFAVVNLEYPRYKKDSIGNPFITTASIINAIHLASKDFKKVVVIGHSAGGSLALLSAVGQELIENIQENSLYFTENFRTPDIVIAQSPILDLYYGAKQKNYLMMVMLFKTG
jgi:acetyl esterase/lipase